MSVSIETLEGLERKITISVAAAEMQEALNSRLQELARSVKIDGFRPGKVPMHEVKKRFADNVKDEVARKMIEKTLFSTLDEHQVKPAGMPSIDSIDLEDGKDFTYSALFEVFPEFDIKESNGDEIERISSEVTAKDVDLMIEKVREQHKKWNEVTRKVAKNDKVSIDFEGFIDDKPFEGGEAKNFEIIIGSGNMIPGFEDGIIGAEIGKPFDIKVTFPADYQAAELAGKESKFAITVNKIFEGELPPLDDDFAKDFNIKEGGVEALKKDIQSNMERELKRRVGSLNREKCFSKLLELNPIELPKVLIDNEIENLKHDMYHRVFGHEHKENEKIPDFPRELFQEEAKKRVHLGLLFVEYIKKHNLSADKKRMDETIDEFASAYESPDELRQWYRTNKEQMAQIENLVLEEMVAEKIASEASIKEKKMTYEEVMNPKGTDKGNIGGE